MLPKSLKSLKDKIEEKEAKLNEPEKTENKGRKNTKAK